MPPRHQRQLLPQGVQPAAQEFGHYAVKGPVAQQGQARRCAHHHRCRDGQAPQPIRSAVKGREQGSENGGNQYQGSEIQQAGYGCCGGCLGQWHTPPGCQQGPGGLTQLEGQQVIGQQRRL